VNFLVDTNVLSEVKRGRGDARVKSWFAKIDNAALYTSVMVVGEIRRGIELIRRRDASQVVGFEAWLGQLQDDFGDRVLPVTQDIAEEWGRLNAPDPLPVIDALLIATARVHDLVIASRNIRDVGHGGAHLLNPWQAG
jgi:predicted nucleic acid-binding protein